MTVVIMTIMTIAADTFEMRRRRPGRISTKETGPDITTIDDNEMTRRWGPRTHAHGDSSPSGLCAGAGIHRVRGRLRVSARLTTTSATMPSARCAQVRSGAIGFDRVT